MQAYKYRISYPAECGTIPGTIEFTVADMRDRIKVSEYVQDYKSVIDLTVTTESPRDENGGVLFSAAAQGIRTALAEKGVQLIQDHPQSECGPQYQGLLVHDGQISTEEMYDLVDQAMKGMGAVKESHTSTVGSSRRTSGIVR